MTAATTAPSIAGQSLTRLVADRASGKEIARFLEGLSPRERVEQVTAIGGRGVAYLYDAAKGAEPLQLEDMVPATESGTVIFEGKNSLPLFTRFQKRFARLGGEIVGYNHQTMAFATGPGYFGVRAASDTGEHAGELYFDYTATPPGRPDGWPEIKPNDRGLSRAVYANMIDYCRRIGPGVLVGKAYKLGVEQKAWFTLTRPR
jgi:hypothetical protein